MKFKYFLVVLLILCLCGTAYASDANTTDAYSAPDGGLVLSSVESVVSDDLISVDETNDYSNVSSNIDVLSSNDDESVLGAHDLYFNASISEEATDADGSKEKPYKYFYTSRIPDSFGKLYNFYLANGVYEIIDDTGYGGIFINSNIIGESVDDTIIYSQSSILFYNDNTISDLTIYCLACMQEDIFGSGSALYLDNAVVNSMWLFGGLYNFENTKFINGFGSYDGVNGTKGGAICCEPYYDQYSGQYLYSYINLINCSFINNNASYGGAIYMKYGNLTIDNCSFINNTAQYYGGAISCDSVNLNINNTVFEDNSAVTNAGGAVYIANSLSNIENINVTGSTALMGGAVVSLNSTLNLFNSNFKKNKVSLKGGAMYVAYSQIGIDECNFVNNTALFGGALFVEKMGLLSIDDYNMLHADDSQYCYVHSSFTNNSAFLGGAIYSYKNNISYSNVYEGNTALDYPDLYENNDMLNLTMYNSEGYPLLKYNPINYTILPDYYNLLDHGWVSPVKNQISDGNCWAFTACAVLESCILKASNGTIKYDFSEENMKNLMAVFSDYGWMVFTNYGGTMDMAAGYLTSWLGPVMENDNQYLIGSLLSPFLKSIFHVQNIIFLKRDNYTDNNMIKDAILKYGAVGTSMLYYPKEYGYNYLNDETYAYYCNQIFDAGNHAVTIVGWDDNYSKDNFLIKPDYDGAWIVKNSWGSDWGLNGYFYVSYYDKMFAPVRNVETAYTILLNDTVAYDKNYQYDLGKTGYWDITGDDTVTYFNIFNIENDEFLAAVSTYFNGIYNYKLEISINGIVNYTKEGTKNPGYYTIPLDKLISLSPGDKLKVLFRLTTVDGSNAAFPYSNGIIKNPVLIEGTSFVDWYGRDLDLVKEYNYIASIKAFTISKPQVNLTVPDMKFTYGESNSIIVSTEASNITATVINHNEASVTVDGKTITVSGLDAGNYVLSVTTDDVLYITKTVTADIIVKKADSSLDDMDSFEFVYGGSGSVSVVYGNASNVTAFVVGHDAGVVVGDHVIVVSDLSAGDYTLNVTTVVGGNHNNVSKSVNFTVKKLETGLYISNTGDNEVYSVSYGDGICNPVLGVFTHDIIAKEVGGQPTAIGMYEKLRNYIVKFNGSVDNVILNGDGSFYLKNLTPGTYDLYVELNDTNRKGNGTFRITINRGVASLEIPEITLVYGESGNVTAITKASEIMLSEPDIFTIINHDYDKFISIDGRVITVLPGIDVGYYTFYFRINDTNWQSESSSVFKVNITKANSSLDDISSFDFDYGDSYVVHVNYGNASNVTAFVVGYDGACVVGDHVIVVSDLSAGDYTLNVTTVVDSNYNNVSKTVNFTVNKRDTQLVILNNFTLVEISSVTYDYDHCYPAIGVYTYDVVEDESNLSEGVAVAKPVVQKLYNYTILFNGSSDNVILENGNFYLKNLTAGTYELYIELNDTNRKGNGTFRITINKGVASLEIPEITLVYGESGNVTAITNAAAVIFGRTGFIPISTNESEEYISIDGKVITVLPGIDVGLHSFSFIVDDPNWQSRMSAIFIVNVTLSNDSLDNINSSEVKYEDAGVISIKVNSTGILGLRASVVGHSEALVKIENNTITISNLTGGDYTLNVTAIGDENHNNVYKTFNLRVKSYSEPKIDISEITPAKTNSIPIDLGNATGNVSLIVDSKVISTTPLVNGSAVVVIPELTTGQHNISIDYSGDYNFSSFKYNKTITVYSLAKITGDDLNAFYLDGSVYKVRVYGDDGNHLIGVKVIFKINGNVVATTTTDKEGYASYKVVQTPKTYNIIIESNGLKLTKKLIIKQVIKAKKTTKVKKSNKVTKIKITLKGKKAYKNKKLTIKFNGKKYIVKTNKKGVAKFKVTKKMIKKFKKAKKVKYTITYSKTSLKRYIKIK